MAAAAEQRLATVTVELHSIYHHAPNTLIAEQEGKWVSQLLSGEKSGEPGSPSISRRKCQFWVFNQATACPTPSPRHATKRKTCRPANPLAREGHIKRTKHLGSQGSRFLAALWNGLK